MTQRNAKSSKNQLHIAAIAVLFLAILACAPKHKIALPKYDEFVSVRQDSIPKGVLEIYGRYAASLSGKTIRSSFNLLLDPGKSAYMEILNPASKLTHAVSLNTNEISLLWAEDANYVEEKASAESVNAIAGIPVMPDDLLYLIAGYGLNFNQWKMDSADKEGWTLSRAPFKAKLSMEENLSKIAVSSASGPALNVRYDQYRQVDGRSLPARIYFEVPARKLQIVLNIDKTVPRDEPATTDLFALKIPDHAHRLVLSDIYHGKPLLLQQ